MAFTKKVKSPMSSLALPGFGAMKEKLSRGSIPGKGTIKPKKPNPFANMK